MSKSPIKNTKPNCDNNTLICIVCYQRINLFDTKHKCISINN
jgi:hypothetical protein